MKILTVDHHSISGDQARYCTHLCTRKTRETNKLKRKIQQTILRLSFSELEGSYICIRNIHSILISNIDDLTDILETDDQGDCDYTGREMPERRFNPDSENLARKTSLMD